MKFNSNRSKIEKEEQMKNMFIEVVENSKGNSGLRLSLNESDGDKIEGMKFCELLVAHVPADNFHKFVESIVEQACFNRNTHQKILDAIRSIAEQYEEMVERENYKEREVMSVPDNMTEDEWEVVLASAEQVESN